MASAAPLMQTSRLGTECPELNHLYRTYAGALTAYVRRQQRDGSDAEDVVQEVFERLARMAPRPHLRQPRAYLYETARRVITDRYRRRCAESRAQARPGALEPPPEFSPEQLLEDRRSLTNAYHAIIHQSEVRCLVFLLARFDGMTVREISARLGIPRSTVQDHIQEVTQACRRAAAT